MATAELFERLAAALAIGLLIGAERGWQKRDEPEGSRAAGIRTFALLGLAGGVTAILAQRVDGSVLGFAVAGIVALMILGHLRGASRSDDLSLTSAVSGVLAFALGALAGAGELAAAGAAAVVATLLLGLKPLLHRTLQRVTEAELMAALKLLLISVVVLPILPDRGYGPYAALNPFEIWLFVVAIAGLSLLGFVAMRAFGTTTGVLLTCALGGLSSSTAVTLAMARHARACPTAWPVLTIGTMLAAAVMLVRIALIVGAVQPDLLAPLALPLAAAALVSAAPLAWSRRAAGGAADVTADVGNPFEIGLAMRFALLLAVAQVAARAVGARWGDAGYVGMAALSGSAEVDAITVATAQMVGTGLPLATAAAAILAAAGMDTLVKAGIAGAIGGRALALRASPILVAQAGVLAAGALWLLLGG
ncbi:MAG: DUF4010 domain-containing protein [Alphaproteobacteria bacterium]|nr:DUF4010 domain-containing protein [Alphaproteobacteria bacterium]